LIILRAFVAVEREHVLVASLATPTWLVMKWGVGLTGRRGGVSVATT
jgi:hypothetical protein